MYQSLEYKGRWGVKTRQSFLHGVKQHRRGLPVPIVVAQIIHRNIITAAGKKLVKLACSMSLVKKYHVIFFSKRKVDWILQDESEGKGKKNPRHVARKTRIFKVRVACIG